MHGSRFMTSFSTAEDSKGCKGVDKNQPETTREKGLNGEEWRAMSLSLTVSCTQAEAIRSLTGAITFATSIFYRADAWIPLVQAIFAGLKMEPAWWKQLTADVAVAAAIAVAANDLMKKSHVLRVGESLATYNEKSKINSTFKNCLRKVKH